MIAMIDNYDSFTYNLVQYLKEIGAQIKVFRNDAIDIPGLEVLDLSGLVISPGPGRPDAAGVSIAAIQHFTGRIPILGVCLGHQAIGMAFGGEIVSARHLMHGKTSPVTADGQFLYSRIPSPFTAMRYHSLALAKASLPPVLEITAESDDGEIMGVRHQKHPTEGIQFHPESIMTSVGKRLLRNFYNQTLQRI